MITRCFDADPFRGNTLSNPRACTIPYRGVTTHGDFYRMPTDLFLRDDEMFSRERTGGERPV